MSKFEYHTIRKGLNIYKQKASKNYYIRMRVHDESGKGQEYVKSLRTPDYDEAVDKAMELYYGYRNKVTSESFVSPKSSTVSSLGGELLPIFENHSKKIYKDYFRVLKNEIIPMFGSLIIKNFDRATIKTYLASSAKSTTQLRIRKTTLKHLFDLAVDKRFIKEYEIPSFPNIDVQSDEVRSMYAKRHLELFNESFESFIGDSTNKKVRTRRIIFRRYFEFLLATGVRPGKEALSLKWSDIYYDNNLFSIRISKGKVHSKSKSSFREIPLSDEAVLALNGVLSESWGLSSLMNLSFYQKDLQSLPKGLIFYRPEAQSTNPQFEKVFNQFCEYCNVSQEEFLYTLYSCRHTYITKQLVKGTDVYLIATNCGTSVEMIQKHYSKLTAVMRS